MEKERKDEDKKSSIKQDLGKDNCCEADNCACSGFFKKNGAIILLLLGVVVLVGGLSFLRPATSDKNALSLDDAKAKASKFIEDNFSDPAYPLNVVSIEQAEEKGLYKLKIDVGGGELIDSYISHDGEKFFPQAFNIEEMNNSTFDEAGDSADVSALSSDERFQEDADFSSDKKVVVYFFWGDGCPHCSSQKAAMVEWLDRYPDIEIKTYETWGDPANGALLQDLAAKYDTTVQGVPMTFIGDEYWVGYAPVMESEMLDKIEDCLSTTCENPGNRL